MYNDNNFVNKRQHAVSKSHVYYDQGGDVKNNVTNEATSRILPMFYAARSKQRAFITAHFVLAFSGNRAYDFGKDEVPNE